MSKEHLKACLDHDFFMTRHTNASKFCRTIPLYPKYIANFFLGSHQSFSLQNHVPILGKMQISAILANADILSNFRYGQVGKISISFEPLKGFQPNLVEFKQIHVATLTQNYIQIGQYSTLFGIF